MNIKNDWLNEKTVNSKDKSLNTVNSETDNSMKTTVEKIREVIEEDNIKPEGVALLLAEGLSDMESLGYYTLLAKNNSNEQLLKALHLTKEADREGKIRTRKAIYFLAIIRKWGLQTRFRK